MSVTVDRIYSLTASGVVATGFVVVAELVARACLAAGYTTAGVGARLIALTLLVYAAAAVILGWWLS